MNRQHTLSIGASAVVLASLLLAACASHDPKKAEPAKAAANKAAGPLAAGYTTLINHAGEPVYCVRRAPTGSNISRTSTCMTAKEWEQLRTNDQETLDHMRTDYEPPPKF